MYVCCAASPTRFATHSPAVINPTCSISSSGRSRSTRCPARSSPSATRSAPRSTSCRKQVGQLRQAGDTAGCRRGCRRAAARSVIASACLPPTLEVVQNDLRELLLRIPNLPHPDAPDGTCDADNPVVTGPVNLPDVVPRAPAGAALGDRRRARHPRQRAGGQDQRGDVHDAARRRRHAGPGPVPARARPQRRRVRGDPARRRWSRRRRSPPPASCRSSPTTPTPSSATTCGASPRPRCRSRRSTPARSSTRPTCRCG